MVLQVNDKWKIKFDSEEKSYIYYRRIEKSEMAAHLQEANKQLTNCQTAVNTFQSYIDDERVVEKIEQEQALPDK